MADVSPKSLANLEGHKFRPGQSGNAAGRNGRAGQTAIARFLEEASADPSSTRFQKILLATYTSAIVPGPKGAADRKTLIEHYAGKPQQAVDLSSEDGSLPSVWDMVMSMNSEQRAAKLAELDAAKLAAARKPDAGI